MITSNSTPRLPRRDNDVTRVKHLARGQVVTNRSAVTALVALAMLNVFTLGAGVAVAGLLPDRLALWQVPPGAGAEGPAPRTLLSPAAPGLPAARPARGAGRLDRPLAVRAPRAHRATGVRRLVVHRNIPRPGLDPRLHQHGQRHADHRAGGGPGPADPVRGAAGRRQ